MRPLALVLFLAASVGCGPVVKCGPGNCSGCCDSSGECQTGNNNVTCGNGGFTCNSCLVGQTCSLGLCSSAGTGGGTGGGTTGGGTGGGTTGGGTGGGMTGGGTGGGTTGGGAGGGTTGGGGGSSDAWETWCTNTYVPGFCDAAVRCGFYSNSTDCQNTAVAFGSCNSSPGLRDGRIVFDNSVASNCTGQFSVSCDSLDVLVCSGVQRGAGMLDAPCYASTECDPNFYCAGSTCPGQCRPTTPAGQTNPSGAICAPGTFLYGSVCMQLIAPGQSCAPITPNTLDRRCVANTFCSPSKVCTPRKVSGQSCSMPYGECTDLLRCVGGFCGPAQALSAPCDSTRPCRIGLRCGPANVCVVSGDIGATCSTQGSGECLPNLTCDIPTGGGTGTCSRIRTLGESCSSLGYQCGITSNLYCTATSTSPGVCALKKGAGASCQSGVECNSSVCTNSMCGCADPTP